MRPPRRRQARSADPLAAERADDGQVYVDRSVVDFDPAEGLYTGTTVDGHTHIPGPHPATTDHDAERPSAVDPPA